MSTTVFNIPQIIKRERNVKKDVIDFYNEATEDYEFWSKDFNMHFGYYIPFKTNPFKRDTMLNEMNNQIIGRLNLKGESPLLIDLGCGMGGTIRHALKNKKNLNAIGVTLSQFQVNEGNKLLKNKKGIILKENYNNTSFKSNSADGVVAIESFCHSGHSKNSFKEAYRILKPNTKLVIADAFLKKDVEDLSVGSQHCYNQLCNGWSLEGLGNISTVIENLKNIGFKNINVEDASFRIAPSVLHVPLTITGFILKKLLKERKLKTQSIKNLKRSLYALLSGMYMKSFGYYIISCTK